MMNKPLALLVAAMGIATGALAVTLDLSTVSANTTVANGTILKGKLGGLRVYLTGNNLAYIWSKDYKGVNPESRMTSGQYSSPMISGYQRGGFPVTSTVTLGVDVKF